MPVAVALPIPDSLADSRVDLDAVEGRVTPVERSGLSRRGLLAGSAAASGALAVGLEAPASAAGLPVNPYTATPIPDRFTRQVLQRFTYGYTPALRSQVIALGGIKQWFERQLNPSTISDTFADSLRTWYPKLYADPATTYTVNKLQNGDPRRAMLQQFSQWSMMRRTYSQRQLFEVKIGRASCRERVYVLV